MALPGNESQAEAIIIDGFAMVKTIPPNSKKTFEECFKEDILPKVQVYSSKYGRKNIVFDTMLLMRLTKCVGSQSTTQSKGLYDPVPCQFSMLSLAVTRCLPSVERGRSQHGNHTSCVR